MAALGILIHQILANRHLRRERVFRDRSNPLEMFEETEFTSRYRFTKDGVIYLCELLSDDMSPYTDRSHSIPLVLKICTALRFCATGSFQLSVGDTSGISQPSVSRIVRKFIFALSNKVENFIVFPTDNDELLKLKQRFYSIASFPNVVGVIDGTHVRIQAPSEGEEAYVNRKGYHSINVQVVMDCYYRIINVVARWPGSTHDSRMLTMSHLWDEFGRGFIPSAVLLGDSGYPNKNWLLTPFPTAHNNNERNYNRAHKKTRTVVERGFGQLKRRWHVLHGEVRMHPQGTCKLITTCCILHNIAKAMNMPEFPDADIHVNDAGDINPPADLNQQFAMRNHIAQTAFMH